MTAHYNQNANYYIIIIFTDSSEDEKSESLLGVGELVLTEGGVNDAFVRVDTAGES